MRILKQVCVQLTVQYTPRKSNFKLCMNIFASILLQYIDLNIHGLCQEE